MRYQEIKNERLTHHYSSIVNNLKLYYHSFYNNDELTINITIENTSAPVLKNLVLYLYDFENQEVMISSLKGIKEYNNHQITFYIDPLSKNEIARLTIHTSSNNKKSKTLALFKGDEHIISYNE